MEMEKCRDGDGDGDGDGDLKRGGRGGEGGRGGKDRIRGREGMGYYSLLETEVQKGLGWLAGWLGRVGLVWFGLVCFPFMLGPSGSWQTFGPGGERRRRGGDWGGDCAFMAEGEENRVGGVETREGFGFF